MNKVLTRRARQATAAILAALIFLLSPGLSGCQAFANGGESNIHVDAAVSARGGGSRLAAFKKVVVETLRRPGSIVRKASLGVAVPADASGARREGGVNGISKEVDSQVKVVADSATDPVKLKAAAGDIQKALEEDFTNPAELYPEAYAKAMRTPEAKKAAKALALLKAPGAGQHVHFDEASGVLGSKDDRVMRFTFYMTASPESRVGKAIHVDFLRKPGAPGELKAETSVEPQAKNIPHALYPELDSYFAAGSGFSPRSARVFAQKAAGFMGDATKFALRFERDAETGAVDLWYHLTGVPARASDEPAGTVSVHANSGAVRAAARGAKAVRWWSAFELVGRFGKAAAPVGILAALLAKTSAAVTIASAPYAVAPSGSAVVGTGPLLPAQVSPFLSRLAAWAGQSLIPESKMIGAAVAVISAAMLVTPRVEARLRKIFQTVQFDGRGLTPDQTTLLADLGGKALNALVAVSAFSLAGISWHMIGMLAMGGTGLAFLASSIKSDSAIGIWVADIVASIRLAFRLPFETNDEVRLLIDGKWVQGVVEKVDSDWVALKNKKGETEMIPASVIQSLRRWVIVEKWYIRNRRLAAEKKRLQGRRKAKAA